MHTRRYFAFTLIELLVVITIIVVLLALLTPALDKAIYQAELASCAANMKAIGSGVTTYAISNKRAYPHRTVLDNSDVPQPQTIKEGAFDDRGVLDASLSLNKMLNDPLSPDAVDLEDQVTDNAYASYMLWFGYGIDGEAPMERMGNRWTWTDSRFTQRFNWLITDMEAIHYAWRGRVQTNHQDNRGGLAPFVRQAEQWSSDSGGPTLTMSMWRAPNNLATKGVIDYNAAGSDGSVIVTRLVEIVGDDRMTYVPLFANYQANGSPWTWRVPKN